MFWDFICSLSQSATSSSTKGRWPFRLLMSGVWQAPHHPASHPTLNFLRDLVRNTTYLSCVMRADKALRKSSQIRLLFQICLQQVVILNARRWVGGFPALPLLHWQHQGWYRKGSVLIIIWTNCYKCPYFRGRDEIMQMSFVPWLNFTCKLSYGEVSLKWIWGEVPKYYRGWLCLFAPPVSQQQQTTRGLCSF